MHVLATQLATLEEADVAVDLGQSPAEMVVLSFSDSDLSALAAAWQQRAGSLPTLRLASLKRLRHPMSVDLYVESVVARAKVVIVRCLGGLDYWRYGLEQHRRRRARARHPVRGLAGRRPRRSAARRDVDPAAATAGAARPLLPRGRGREPRQALRYAGTLLGRDAAWRPPVPVGPITVLGRRRATAPGGAGRLLSRQPDGGRQRAGRRR